MNTTTTTFPSAMHRLALAGWLLLCFAAATMGALFMPGEWYATLKKPVGPKYSIRR